MHLLLLIECSFSHSLLCGMPSKHGVRTLKEVQNILDVMRARGCNHVSRQFAASISSLCDDCADVYMLTVTAPSKLPHLSSKLSVVMAAENDLRCHTLQ